MYPLDFEEFAWALGKSQLVEYVKECFLGQKPLADALHKEAMLLFREYMIVGGRDATECHRVHRKSNQIILRN